MTTDAELGRILGRALPNAHRLNYFAVLGSLKGLLMCLGYSDEESERKAIETLKRCKPQRERRRT